MLTTSLSALLRPARIGALAAAALLAQPLGASAQDAGKDVFSNAEKQAIGEIVREYLITNPQLMLEVMDALDTYESEIEEKQQAASIAANRDALEQDGFSFIAGNPDGAITVVEFFDYRCPYCKQVADDMTQLIEGHDDVRLVLKEFPILGPNSTVASQAAIAAIPQGKYLDFHFALLESKGTLDRDKVMEIAEETGLDTDKLARDMETARVETIIDTNHTLARDIGVRGTPAFIIGDRLIPGAASIEEIEARIQAVRDSAEAG
jgi:protein-disulfide isomerase